MSVLGGLYFNHAIYFSVLVFYVLTSLFGQPVIDTSKPPLEIPAAVESTFASCAVVDMTANTILYEKDIEIELSPTGSAVTLMTAYVAMSVTDSNTEIEIASVPEIPAGSRVIGIRSGEVWNIDDLLAAMLLHGAQDAAMIIADHIGNDTADFITMMNVYSSDLGMEHTKYTSPHGAYDAEQYTTVSDMIILADAVCKNERLNTILSQSEYQPVGNHATISNRLRFMNPGRTTYDSRVTGMGTGMTDQSGLNLIITATDGSRDLLVVAYSPTPEQSAGENATIDLLDHFYTNYRLVDCTSIVTAMVQEYEGRLEDGSVFTCALIEDEVLFVTDIALADTMESDTQGYSIQVDDASIEIQEYEQQIVHATVLYNHLFVKNLALQINAPVPYAGMPLAPSAEEESNEVEIQATPAPTVVMDTRYFTQMQPKQSLLERMEWLFIIIGGFIVFSGVLILGLTLRKKIRS